MKKILLITIVLIIPFIAVCQKITVSGKVTLENNIDNSGVKVLFKRLAPSEILDSTYTDFIGNFNYEIEKGIYIVNYFKNKFFEVPGTEYTLYANTILTDVKLFEHWLVGNIYDTLPVGTYNSNGDIIVPEGKTLIILPGTTIRLKEGVSFIVNGKLVAKGTAKDSIKFTEYEKGKGWNGLKFLKDGLESYSILEYVDLEKSNYQGVLVESFLRRLVLKLNRVNIHNNANNGVEISNNDHVEIFNSRFNNNKESGLKINAIQWGNMIVDNCIATNNRFYGFDLHGGIISVTNCTSYNNGYSGFLMNGQKSKITNCISAFNGVGMDLANDIKLFNNNIYQEFPNKSNVIKGGNAYQGKLVTINSKGDSTDAYNNIFVNPLFKDPSNYDFSLKPESHCINAGVNDSVISKEDIQGNIRIMGGVVDMGALEFDIPTSIIEDELNSEKLIIYPNPANNLLFIKNNSSDLYSVSILNNLGQTILQFSNESTLNISDLIHGMYLIKISTPTETITYRFLKL